jgi:protein-disulfide isomerase
MNSTGRSTPPFHTYALVALLGVSMGLNGFMALKAYKPTLLHELELAMISPPVLRSGDHIRGVQEASVTVIEYSDFQCPYCAQIHESLKKLAEASKIKWVYRNLPLSSIHPYAIDAAKAAECAGQQDKFWEYADALFESQAALRTTESPGTLFTMLAKRVGMEETRFRSCVSSNQVEDKVRAQGAEAISLRVESTPTIFINGKREVGALPLEQLELLVQNRKD